MLDNADQAIEVVNIRGHQEIKNEFVGELLAKGYYIGRKVKLTRRISLNMAVDESNETKYADVAKFHPGFVQGMLNGLPVISFNVKFRGGEERNATACVKPENLSFDVGDEPSSSSGLTGTKGSGGGGGTKIKGFEFLKKDDDETIVVHKKWVANSATVAVETKLRNLHSRLGMALASLMDEAPKYSESDLHVIVRNGKTEVWTAKDFPAHGLVLVPETTEWKDRYWCQGSSALVKYGTMRLHVLTLYLFLMLQTGGLKP